MGHAQEQGLLIDVGSSSIKARVCTLSTGEVRFETSRPSPSASPHVPAGRHEIDARELRARVFDVIEEAVKEANPGILALSTQMHSALLADADGEPLSPLITWQDDRLLEESPVGAGSFLDEVATRIPAEARAAAGVALRPGYGAGNLMAYIRECGVPGGATVHTVGSYLIRSFGGPAVTHLTNAAALGLVDLDRSEWSTALVEGYGLAGCALPAIAREYAPIGVVDIAGTSMALYPDYADHQASVIGAGGIEPGDVALSLGTAGIVARWSATRSQRTDIDSRPYIDGSYLLTASRQPGGRIASSAMGFLATIVEGITGHPVSHDDVWNAAERVFGSAPLAHSDPLTRFEIDTTRTEGDVLRVRGVDRSDQDAFRDLMSSFVQVFVRQYQRSIDVLFMEDDDVPQRLCFNGGLAMRGTWFRNQIAAGLGLDVASYPTTDLAILGVHQLVRTDRESRSACAQPVQA